MNLLTSSQVMQITGIGCRSTLWRAVRANQFPSPLVLGARSIRWRVDEVEGWINSRPRRRYALTPDAAAGVRHGQAQANPGACNANSAEG